MLPLLQGWTVGLDAVTVCIIDGFLRVVLESWYAIVPTLVILGDPILGKDLPGLNGLKRIWRSGQSRVAKFWNGIGWGHGTPEERADTGRNNEGFSAE